MRFSGSLFLIASGATLIVSGFAYDLEFAGLPYQVPTAGMQERWLFHKGVSERILLTGVAFFGFGCVWKAAQRTINLSKKQHKY
jgi:hypothetical protein